MIKLALRIILPILVVAVAGYATVTMIRNRPAPETREADVFVPLVETMTVDYDSIRMSVYAEGTVVPRTQSQLVPEVSGRVVEVSPSMVDGGFFEEGDVLLRLDPREYELAIVRSRAAIAQAELRVETELQEAAIAEQEWELLGRGEPSSLALREPQIAEARAALASAEAALKQAEYDLERTVLRAPYAGRVREENVDTGQYVSRGAPVATIYSVDVAEVRLPIPDEELAYIDVPVSYRNDRNGLGSVGGPRVTLRARFGGEEHQWRGEIVRTAGEIDPGTRMVHVVAQVDDPYGRSSNPNRPPLAIGMFVEAEIHGRTSGRVVVLPRSALRGRDQVLVVEDGLLRFRRVEFLREERDQVLIKAGLEEGDEVVVSPLEGAVDGMRVRARETSSAETDATFTPGR